MITDQAYNTLKSKMNGSFHLDETTRALYATDASAYREIPEAVAYPKNEDDIIELVNFARENNTSLIPRTAGTSLAGQVVGGGIVVDVSRYMTKILELNKEEGWVKVQPGVIRDELNMYLDPHDLFFAPETSTANRAMIGGMIGNNSCGANSVVYGSTRDHLVSVKAVLSDGSVSEFSSLKIDEFKNKKSGTNVNSDLEGKIYKQADSIFCNDEIRKQIIKEFPNKNIPRRNTGYAIDLLMDADVFSGKGDFNFCKLIAGSEGTLAFITEAKLNVGPKPKGKIGLLCVHFKTIYDSLRGNLIALKYNPGASELMDHYILECTKDNIGQRQNRFFVKGDPAAILIVELRRETVQEIKQDAKNLVIELKENNLGYHYPLVLGEDTKKVWELRKAGLGLLSNMPGDAKPVPVVEDTAVDVRDLPEYISEFNKVIEKYGLYCVHYAHAGSGELHLRPILNLKTEEGTQLYKTILEEIAELVKKYKGSLSGEHGDGRLRGEYIPFMIGRKNYQILKDIKKTWDPYNIFNPGKIVDTPAMNTSLRYKPGQKTKEFDTALNFDSTLGILRAAEQCNGTGDCRKTELTGGTMCPSYMATRNEKDTTRARANIFREVITNSINENPFDSPEIMDVMDLCLSCKGCKSECPSNVDIAKIKAEFLHQYYQSHSIPFRSRLFSSFADLNKIFSKVHWIYNLTFSNVVTERIAKMAMGIAPRRSMPRLAAKTLLKWFKNNKKKNFGLKDIGEPKGKVYLFCDEFTNYNDVEIGKTAIKLLSKLGYEVEIPHHYESGRAALSKGLLNKASKLAEKNVSIFKDLISQDTPLIGIEPSAILSFRDEYPDLVDRAVREKALQLSGNCYLIDEFLAGEIKKGNITQEMFNEEKKLIKMHGHCHQKALSSQTPTKIMLSLPKNYEVHLIRSGCCGMAGSFGYEKEHYDLSMNIGELVLFPAIKELPEDVLIAAPGTSCRHQIMDGTGRRAFHPVEILWNALK